jgi:hypothetical protein
MTNGNGNAAKVTAMQGTGGTLLGAQVFTDLVDVESQLIDRGRISEIMAEVGLSEEWGPDEVTGQWAFGRALSKVRNLEAAKGISVEREEVRSRVALVRAHEGDGLAKETATWARVYVDDLDSLVIEWSDRPGVEDARRGIGTPEDVEIARRCGVALGVLQKTYESKLDFLTASDFGAHLRKLIEGRLRGMRLRRNGGVWFVPASHHAELRMLARVVEHVGTSDLPFVEIRGGTSYGVDKTLRRTFLGEVAKVIAEARALGKGDKGPRESAVLARVEKLEELTRRATSCRDVLREYEQDIATAIAAAKVDVMAVLDEELPTGFETDGEGDSEAA